MRWVPEIDYWGLVVLVQVPLSVTLDACCSMFQMDVCNNRTYELLLRFAQQPCIKPPNSSGPLAVHCQLFVGNRLQLLYVRRQVLCKGLIKCRDGP